MIAKRSVRHARARLSAPAALLLFAVIGSCGTTSSTSPSSASSATDVPAPSTSDTDPVSGGGSLVIVGRIVTMDDPPIVEALLIEEGVVSAIGSRDDVLAQADDEVPVIEIGDDVAYPGFIDAHAHWIGDRDYYGIDTPAAAMDAASSLAGPRSASSGSTRRSWTCSPDSQLTARCRSASMPTWR
jgi:hypothetical protein